MARPKSNKPKKQKLTLTVKGQSRVELNYISAHTGKSISELVEEWAAKESAAISKETGVTIPYEDQINIAEHK